MYNIIPLILISVSFFVIIFVIARKFSALANLDVENMPSEKEARFKEQIASNRLKRNITKWSSSFVKIFKAINSKTAGLFKIIYDRLHEVKKDYEKEEYPLTEVEKEEKIKELFDKTEDMDDKDDFEEKEASLIKIIELDSQNADAFRDLGEFYAENKKYEEAKQAFAHTLKLLKDEEIDKQSAIYYDLALVYQSTGENQEALETIRGALKLEPNNPRYLDAALDISLINKDKILAIKYFDKMMEVNPENAKLKDIEKKIKELG